ncbi:MAG: hypothetical protein CVU43_14615 [Chloroflexi bacterium HGW-Chloroflexi-5]|nr:MAG: hypothetical protein CVU43_14615 [Chloroflexi bacterium HGW-Chloroflexi-5]
MYESQRNTKSNLRLKNISNHQTLDEVIKEPFGDDVVEYIFYHISIYPLSSVLIKSRVFSLVLDPRGFDWTEEVSITKPRGSAFYYTKQKSFDSSN